MFYKFRNRTVAGRDLALALSQYKDAVNTIILALPRGGVPVAAEVARILNLPLDIWIVRKLGVPGHEELAMGAIAPGKANYINQNIIQNLHISQEAIERTIIKERAELDRRNKLYREERPLPRIHARTVIIVDDGLATGATMKIAAESLRQKGATHIIAASPVGSYSACHLLSDAVDEIICLQQPEPFYGVGRWYEDFSQTTDADVKSILSRQTEMAE